jgi:hypothetical protein
MFRPHYSSLNSSETAQVVWKIPIAPSGRRHDALKFFRCQLQLLKDVIKVCAEGRFIAMGPLQFSHSLVSLNLTDSNER